MDTLLRVQDLTKRFGPVTAVDRLRFELTRGEVLGFLGPNGAGKSTTMKMITGFLPPSAGQVELAGHVLASDPLAVKRRIGYLPEGAPAYQDLTPDRLLRFVAEIRGLRGAERRRRIADTVARVHLEDVLDQPIETLSKGFKRRVGLAQAILHDPPVLILDEPTDGLDPNQKHEVRELIRGMAPEKVIILSTHILEEMEAVCNRAMLIAAGRIVADTTPAELESRSRLHQAVTVSLDGITASEARKRLGGLKAARSVEILDGDGDTVRLRVMPTGREPLAAAVSGLARDQGWSIRELFVERGRLDEVFRELTSGEAS